MNTPDFLHETTLKVGLHRGNPRVWIEGAALARAGFTPTDRFRATFSAGSIILELDPAGTRTISGRTRDGRTLPIIDMNAAEITAALGSTERIAVKLTTHRIEITPSRIALATAARVLTALAVGLFAGGGLLSHAARAAGFETVAAVERDEAFAEIHALNHGGATLAHCIAETDFAALRARTGPVGLVHAGIPCEPFSTIRRGAAGTNTAAPEAHELGDMTFWALRAIDQLNPHTALIEEVPAWLDSGAGWIARHALTRMGYTVDARVLDASDFGAITSRRRAFMVATTFPVVRWPEPIAPAAPLASILLDPADPRCDWFGRSTASKRWLFDHWAKQTTKGNGFASAVIHYTDARLGCIKKRYLAGQGDNPVVAHPTAAGLFRWLTLDELKRIMGLPDTYHLGTAKTTAGEILGQGVHVGAAAHLIRSITATT